MEWIDVLALKIYRYMFILNEIVKTHLHFGHRVRRVTAIEAVTFCSLLIQWRGSHKYLIDLLTILEPQNPSIEGNFIMFTNFERR